VGLHPAAGSAAARMTGIPLIAGRGHRGHAPRYEVQGGRRLPNFDHVDRIERIVAELDMLGGFELYSPREHGTEPVLAVHDPALLSFLELASAHAAASEEELIFGDTFLHEGLRDQLPLRNDGLGFNGLFGRYCLDTITGVTPATLDAALESVDVAVTAAEDVAAGAPLAVALTRPPGHHVSRSLFGGGCFLNNTAIAAELLRRWAHDRVAILDVDVHHGNGSQALFYDRDDVLFASIHADPAGQFPFFLGFADERGSGAGEGYNLNGMLPADARLDGYRSVLEPALNSVAAYRPDVLVVSLGVDGHEQDPCRAARLATEDFRRIGSDIGALRVPAVVVLEGGYALDVLGPSVAGWLEGFTESFPAATAGAAAIAETSSHAPAGNDGGSR